MNRVKAAVLLLYFTPLLCGCGSPGPRRAPGGQAVVYSGCYIIIEAGSVTMEAVKLDSSEWRGLVEMLDAMGKRPLSVIYRLKPTNRKSSPSAIVNFRSLRPYPEADGVYGFDDYPGSLTQYGKTITEHEGKVFYYETVLHVIDKQYYALLRDKSFPEEVRPLPDKTPPVTRLSSDKCLVSGKGPVYLMAGCKLKLFGNDAETEREKISEFFATYYSVDGGISKRKMKKYTEPFSLEEGRHSVAFYSIDIAGNEEAVRTRDVLMDVTPPDISYDVENGNIGADGSVFMQEGGKFSIKASDSGSGVGEIAFYLNADPRTCRGSWNGGDPNCFKRDYSIPFSIGGPNLLYLLGTDRAGNTRVVGPVIVRPRD